MKRRNLKLATIICSLSVGVLFPSMVTAAYPREKGEKTPFGGWALDTEETNPKVKQLANYCGDGETDRPIATSLASGGELCDYGSYSWFDNNHKTAPNYLFEGTTKANAKDKPGIKDIRYKDNACNEDCSLKKDFHGNGIIEYISGKWESCDAGEINQESYCSDKGEIIGSEFSYPAANDRCGNGILDLDDGEKCDSGRDDYSFSNVCKDDCSGFKSNTVNLNGRDYQCDNKYEFSDGSNTIEMHLCGDGHVDSNAGEQCDLGYKRNGKNGENCTKDCTWVKAIKFSKNNVLFYEYDDSKNAKDVNIIDGRPKLGKRAVGEGVSSKYLFTDVGGHPLNPKAEIGNKVHIMARGQVIKIDEDPAKQYSGIFLADPPTGNSVDISFLVTSADFPNNNKMKEPMDDDSFGLVLGVPTTDGDLNQDDLNRHYLMLRWRSEEDVFGGGFADVSPNRCNKPTHTWPEVVKFNGSNQGLRLYSISGKPHYNELWNMKNCDEDHTRIQEINTRSNEKWNKIVNSAYTFSTHYLSDFNFVIRKQNVFHFNVHYSGNGIIVWLNGNKVIDIDLTQPGADKLKAVWPTSRNWGFYVLGMDNIKADFRIVDPGYIVTDDDKILERFDDAQGTRCGRCGDGIINGISTKEDCDLGTVFDLATKTYKSRNGQVDSGCNIDCSIMADFVCSKNFYPGSAGSCIGGDVLSPKANVTLSTATPAVKGTYKGAKPAKIEVNFHQTGQSENSDCTVEVPAEKIANDKSWTLPEDDFKKAAPNCNLTTGDIDLDVKIYSSDSSIFKKITHKFTYDDTKIKYVWVRPKDGKAYTLAEKPPKEQFQNIINISKNNIKLSDLEVKVNFPYLNGSKDEKCNLTQPNQGNEGYLSGYEILATCNYNSSLCDTKNNSCEIHLTFTAEDKTDSSKTVTETRTIYIDNAVPNVPKIIVPTPGSDSVGVEDMGLNNIDGGKITVVGKVEPVYGQGDQSPEFVTIVVTDGDGDTGNLPPTVVPVESDGSFTAKVPVPKPKGGYGRYTVQVTARDKAGNESAPAAVSGLKPFEIHGDLNPTLKNYVEFVKPSINEKGILGPDDIKDNRVEVVVKLHNGATIENQRIEYCEVGKCGPTGQTCKPSQQKTDITDIVCTIPASKFTNLKKYKIFTTPTVQGKPQREVSIEFTVDKEKLPELSISQPIDGSRVALTENAEYSVTVELSTKLKNEEKAPDKGDVVYVQIQDENGNILAESKHLPLNLKNGDNLNNFKIPHNSLPKNGKVKIVGFVLRSANLSIRESKPVSVTIGPDINITKVTHDDSKVTVNADVENGTKDTKVVAYICEKAPEQKTCVSSVWKIGEAKSTNGQVTISDTPKTISDTPMDVKIDPSKDYLIITKVAVGKAEVDRGEPYVLNASQSGGASSVGDGMTMDVSGPTDDHKVTITVKCTDKTKCSHGDDVTITIKDENGNVITTETHQIASGEATVTVDVGDKKNGKIHAEIGKNGGASVDGTFGSTSGDGNQNPGSGDSGPKPGQPEIIGNKNGETTVTYVCKTEDNCKAGDDVTITFTSDDDKTLTKTVKGKIGADGKTFIYTFHKGEFVADNGTPMKFPVSGNLEITDSSSNKKTEVKFEHLVVEVPTVGGGCGECSATGTPEGGLITLILGALGLAFLRRRRED